jgi:hypothetical protein
VAQLADCEAPGGSVAILVIEGVPFGLPLEPVRFPREGAGLLSSSASDGVGRDLTRVEPGQVVDCFYICLSALTDPGIRAE